MTETDTSNSLYTLLTSLLSLLTEHYNDETLVLDEEDEILEGWVAIESRADRLAKFINQSQYSEISKELRNLQNHSLYKIGRRPLRKLAQIYLDKTSEAENIYLKQTLDASKRTAIVRETVTSYATLWLEQLKPIFENDTKFENFKENFHTTEYSKGVVGAMVDSAAMASLSENGLDSKTLGDMSYILIRTLSKEIQTVNDLQRKHVDCLIKNIVIPFDEKVIQLWSKTAKISAIGSKNEGNLTEKWKKEEKEKRLKIREYVREHGVDAKFSPRAKHKFEKRAKRMDRFRLLQSAIASQLQLSPMNSPKNSHNLCKSSIPQLNDNVEYKSSPLKPADIDAEIEIDLNDFSLDKSNDALLNDLTRNNFENEEINENNNDNDNEDDN
eukprot:CAMPEP_0168600642 /NCGR_PEP_ID=MMETSP0420-20121227/12907_1 /TAXON_ID=498008 /ORGANISM="Pessonella sp." /LENGTH=384 /DNA_ID=CAMNT_0008638775 /DNA_START=36 /DNA_END=1187 /DNA_ORIENTATION=+